MNPNKAWVCGVSGITINKRQRCAQCPPSSAKAGKLNCTEQTSTKFIMRGMRAEGNQWWKNIVFWQHLQRSKQIRCPIFSYVNHPSYPNLKKKKRKQKRQQGSIVVLPIADEHVGRLGEARQPYNIYICAELLFQSCLHLPLGIFAWHWKKTSKCGNTFHNHHGRSSNTLNLKLSRIIFTFCTRLLFHRGKLGRHTFCNKWARKMYKHFKHRGDVARVCKHWGTSCEQISQCVRKAPRNSRVLLQFK